MTQQFTHAKQLEHANNSTIHQTEHKQMNNNILTSEPSLASNKGLSLWQKSVGSILKSCKSEQCPSHKACYAGSLFEKSLPTSCI